MSIEQITNTKLIYIYPNGEYNETVQINITKDGILLDDYELISWNIIDNGRKELE